MRCADIEIGVLKLFKICVPGLVDQEVGPARADERRADLHGRPEVQRALREAARAHRRRHRGRRRRGRRWTMDTPGKGKISYISLIDTPLFEGEIMSKPTYELSHGSQFSSIDDRL